MKRERLIANSTRPCTVRRTARPRPRGAPRRARRPGPGGGDARTHMAWYVATVAVRRRDRHMGVGRPSRSRPRERARRAERFPGGGAFTALADTRTPPVARVAPGRPNEKSDNHQQTRSRSDVGWQLTLETRDQRLRLYPRTCTPMSYLTRRDGGWSRRAAGRVRHSRAPLCHPMSRDQRGVP